LNDGSGWTVTIASTDLYNSGNGKTVAFTNMSVTIGATIVPGGTNAGGAATPGAAGPTTLSGGDAIPGTTLSGSVAVASGTSAQQGTYTQTGNTITVITPANVANSGVMTATIQYSITG
jgi:hypothetical protein